MLFEERHGKRMSKKVIIIGGGASGLMAAITAAQKGACVTIIEHKEKPGKKILMTGNGKCNLTNVSDIRGKYYGEQLDRIYALLERFSAEDTRAFFQQIGNVYRHRRAGDLQLICQFLLGKAGFFAAFVNPVGEIHVSTPFDVP